MLYIYILSLTSWSPKTQKLSIEEKVDREREQAQYRLPRSTPVTADLQTLFCMSGR